MKYFIFLGFFLFPILSPSDNTTLAQFLLNENSVITPDNLRTELEKRTPEEAKKLFNNTILGDETALQLIARRLQNGEEILRSIENIVRYLHKYVEDKDRTLESLFSFIYKDEVFTSKYDSEQDYPKIALFLSKLKEAVKTQENFRTKLNSNSSKGMKVLGGSFLSITGLGTGAMLTNVFGAPDPLFFGTMTGYAVLGFTAVAYLRKSDKLVKEIETCKQNFMSSL